MNKFTLGMIAGASSLALAVPIVVQVAGAQSSSAGTPLADRPVPSQACLQAMVGQQDLMLARFDRMSQQQKAMLQQHRDAMNAAASITDDTQRRAALEKAREDMHAAKEAAFEEPSSEMTAAMEAVRDACGGAMGFKGMMKGPGMMGAFGHKGFGSMGGRGFRGMNDSTGSRLKGTRAPSSQAPATSVQ